MYTVAEIRQFFECSSNIAFRILGLQRTAYKNGLYGEYEDCQYNNHSNWIKFIKPIIVDICKSLTVDDAYNMLIDTYFEAHVLGLEDKNSVGTVKKSFRFTPNVNIKKDKF